MNQNEISPQESLAIISDMIAKTKARFEANGHIYLFWGVLLTLASFAQFLLLQLEYYSINYYPYFLVLLGWVYMFWNFSKKDNRSRNKSILSMTINSLWICVGVNSALLGFLVGANLTTNLIPILLIILSVAVITSGVALKSWLLISVGILSNIIGFIAFEVGYLYQPLLNSVVFFAVLVVPGFRLRNRSKQK